MKAEILTIGDELLIGQTVNTNSAWMATELNKTGVEICRIVTVADKREEILNALADAIGKVDLVFITGGLGPTSDDITKPALCEFFETRLVFNADVFNEIENLFRHRNIRFSDTNRMQAEVPENCSVYINRQGTAPGMRFIKGGTTFYSMAGVPFEMKHIMTDYVLPELRLLNRENHIIHRNIMVFGIPESTLSDTLNLFEAELPEFIKLAYLPSFGSIKLRLSAQGSDEKFLSDTIEHNVNKLYQIIPQYIYGEDEVTLEKVIGDLLIDRKMTLCTIESCTGGTIAELITANAGSSAYYKGSVLAYDNSIKTELLNIPGEIIAEWGAVSEQTVTEMAARGRILLKSDFSVATSGIAGPDGGTADKPVGTVWIAVSSATGTIAKKLIFGNNRNINIKRFSYAALDMLRRQIISE